MINVATIKNNIVTNIFVYEDMKEASYFNDLSAFVDADDFKELPDGFGVDDTYDPITGEFHKKIIPPVPVPEDPISRIDTLEQALIKALGGVIND